MTAAELLSELESDLEANQEYYAEDAKRRGVGDLRTLKLSGDLLTAIWVIKKKLGAE
jgi:hypothetical protein